MSASDKSSSPSEVHYCSADPCQHESTNLDDCRILQWHYYFSPSSPWCFAAETTLDSAKSNRVHCFTAALCAVIGVPSPSSTASHAQLQLRSCGRTASTLEHTLCTQSSSRSTLPTYSTWTLEQANESPLTAHTAATRLQPASPGRDFTPPHSFIRRRSAFERVGRLLVWAPFTSSPPSHGSGPPPSPSL